jgi:hypothetical protein
MKKLVTLAFTAVLFSGCDTATRPTPENYLATINKYMADRRDCLLAGIRFPFETSDPTQTRQMNALVTARVLAVTTEPAIHVSRYTQTPSGIAAGISLCYGYRQATAIVSSTPPALANGFTETTVVYKYAIRDTPVWAKTPEVVAAFPVYAREMTGDATDTITLALTRVSWSVPN